MKQTGEIYMIVQLNKVIMSMYPPSLKSNNYSISLVYVLGALNFL